VHQLRGAETGKPPVLNRVEAFRSNRKQSLENEDVFEASKRINLSASVRSSFFHPDYTVGFGISPNPALARSRAVPPIGNSLA